MARRYGHILDARTRVAGRSKCVGGRCRPDRGGGRRAGDGVFCRGPATSHERYIAEHPDVSVVLIDMSLMSEYGRAIVLGEALEWRSRKCRVTPSHPLSTFQQRSLVVLRTFIGWHFLYEGYYKFSCPPGPPTASRWPPGPPPDSSAPPAARWASWPAPPPRAACCPGSTGDHDRAHRRGHLADAGPASPASAASAGCCCWRCST